MGALALMIACSRSAIVRSDSGISAIFASTSASPSASHVPGPRRAAFSSCTRSFRAVRSSSVNPCVLLVSVRVDVRRFLAELIRLPGTVHRLHLRPSPFQRRIGYRTFPFVAGSIHDHHGTMPLRGGALGER